MNKHKICPHCGEYFNWHGIKIKGAEYCTTPCFEVAWAEKLENEKDQRGPA